MTADQASEWWMIPRFLLRRAGFGFDLADSLADEAVAQAAARYRSAWRRAEGTREVLLRRVLPEAVAAARAAADRDLLRSLSALRSRVGRRHQVTASLPGADRVVRTAIGTYAESITELAAAASELEGALRAELADRPARLRKSTSPAVLDAIVQLAPSFYDSLSRWLAAEEPRHTARDRAMARRYYLYVQRLAAKNETTSFFGPLLHGIVDPGVVGVRFGPDTAAGVTETTGYLAFWAVVALARQLAADRRVRSRIPVTWIAAARIDGTLLTLPTGRRRRLDPGTASLAAAIQAAPGGISEAGLARAAARPADEISHEITTLERLCAVRRWPEPASTAAQPLTQLRAAADAYAVNTEWPRQISHLSTLLDEYAHADGHVARRAALDRMETAFTGLARTGARRAGGQMYADRMVGYLECAGDLAPVRLGHDAVDRLVSALAPVLDFGACRGEAVRQAFQDLAAGVLRAAGTERMPYAEFTRRTGAAVADGALTLLLAKADEARTRFAVLVRDHLRDDRVAVLDAADLRTLGSPGPEPRFASPDVLIRQSGTGPHLVLGEVHPYAFAWGSQALFCPDPAGLLADFSSDLSPWGGPESIATVVRRRAHKGLVSDGFPGRFIEVTAVASTDRGRVLPVTELDVEQAGGRVRLRGRDGEIVLYAGEDDHSHLAAFAPAPVLRLPAIRFGDFAPRIVVGDLIAQRACWWIPADTLSGGGSPAVFRQLQRLRADLGLPRWVYAHVSGEPKPVCLDLDAPLAVEVLTAMAARVKGTEVALAEMTPEPDALWLRKQGQATTSELRIALIRSGGRWRDADGRAGAERPG